MKNVHVIELEVKGKEWETILDNSFKKKIKNVKVDGFRKGSVPKEVYIKKFGIESLYMDAVDEALKIAYKELMTKNNIIPVIEPKVDIKHICNDCVTFSFTIITKPEIILGEYKNLKIKKEKVEVSNNEINEEIESLRNKFADVVVKEDGKLTSGNTAIINFEGYVDNKLLEGATGSNYPLEIGSHTFIPGFEDGLIGMTINEEKELKLKFPDNYTEDLKGKDVLFKVKLIGIKERILPELNQTFYGDLGFENVKNEDDLRKEVEKNIKARKEVDVENLYIEKLLKKATDNMKVELNHEIVDEEINRMIHQYEDQLKMQGLSLEQYFEFTKGNIEDLKKNMEPEATKRIKYRYLLEEIATKEHIEIALEEAKKETKKLAETYGVTEEEFLKQYGGLEMVKYDLSMRKAIEILKTN